MQSLRWSPKLTSILPSLSTKKLMAQVTVTSIAIENLGPFRDRQVIELHVQGKRPVILLKALNGSGKTTLLTALQIGLYGYKAINAQRRSQYEQLVLGLQRKDAVGPSRVEIVMEVEMHGTTQSLRIRREWTVRGTTLVESCVVYSQDVQDLELTADWEEYIEGILPAELVQLFLFDGEKIESLANPERLPDLLRRATEVFLGIGGIESLGNDLKAVERRALLRGKDNSANFEAARSVMQEQESQADSLRAALASHIQEQAHARNILDQAQMSMDRYVLDAKRSGLNAYQDAAELRALAKIAEAKVAESQGVLAEALSDPLAPLAWAPKLWEQYKSQWDREKVDAASREMIDAMRQRDRRILQSVAGAIPSSAVDKLKSTLKGDLEKLTRTERHRPILQLSANPTEIEDRISISVVNAKVAVEATLLARGALEKAERKIGAIPAEEQLGTLVTALGEKSKLVADAEAALAAATQAAVETQGRIAHLEIKVNASRARLMVDFKDKSYEAKSLEAAARAKQAFILFKERMLASKAKWLSEMITNEFRNLLRKKNLFAKVLVDPVTYRVSIEDPKQHELPMDRLSAGERQLLAIAVLSALITERKGRFPVVVDTPLARLDRHHRESLVRRFFSTVSHQVIVLSTDEEVDGSVYDALRPYTSREYVLHFDDATRSTKVETTAQGLGSRQIAETAK